MIDFDENIKLGDWGVMLRPWATSDLSLITESVFDPHTWRFTTEAILDKDELAKYVDRALSDRRDNKRFSFAICLEGSEQIVGNSSFGNVSTKDNRIEIGWTWLAKEFHGKGLNNVVKYLMMKYGFEVLGAHRIEFKTDNSNPRACKALEKIGTQREGVLRSHTLMHDGRYRDTAFFSVLDTEWNEVEVKLSNLIKNDNREYNFPIMLEEK